MSSFRRFEIVERRSSPKPLFPTPPRFPAFPIFENELEFPPFFFDESLTVTDPIKLQALCDRVSDLERLLREEKAKKEKEKEKEKEKKKKKLEEEKKKKKLEEEKKYTWTAEVETAEKHRKYKWSSEIKGGEDEKRSYKWTVQIKGKGGSVERTYTVEVVGSGAKEEGEKKKKVKVKEISGKSAARITEIEQPSDHGAIVLRQAFTKWLEKKKKGKSKELSPSDAAALIQMSFRTYLIRRSQALRALRELAIAKTKLKDIRALFNNFTYRRRLSREAEERQRFSEKIIVLLLTVDAIEGADLMVRSAKKSMVDELEAMLDVVDPHEAPGKPSIRRRTFDMPDGVINKELAAGVAKVIEMLDEESSDS